MQPRRPSFPARLDTGPRPPAPRPATGSASGSAGVMPASGHPGHSATASGAPAAAARRLQAATDAAPRGLGLDSEAVRSVMVRKLAAQGISDPRVLAAMGAVPRHGFVDSALVNQAYEDTSLPIGLGQTISKPSVVARMAELLLGGLPPGSQRLGRILEIGTGCGYQAAVLSLLATEVYSIERLRGLHERARHNLRPLRLANVHLLFADGMLGYAKGGPYAGIIAAAGGEAVPQAWLDQLAVGGRIVAPAQTAGGGQALHVIERTAHGVRHNVLEPVHFVPLKSGIA